MPTSPARPPKSRRSPASARKTLTASEKPVKYAFWFYPNNVEVMDAVAGQTGLKKSRILRELLMAYGAGIIRPPSLPEVSPIKVASTYVTERLTAGKD